MKMRPLRNRLLEVATYFSGSIRAIDSAKACANGLT